MIKYYKDKGKMMFKNDKKKPIAVYIRGNKTPKTALYCRTASPCYVGIEKQQKMLQEYATANGHTNTVFYCDNGSSGLNFDRNGFKKLNQDIRSGDIKTIIVCDISRISRQIVDTIKWVNELRKNGGELITLHGDFDDCAELINNMRDIFKKYRLAK